MARAALLISITRKYSLRVVKKYSLSTILHLYRWLTGSPNTLARNTFLTTVALLGVSFQEVLSQINIQGFGVLASTHPLCVRILLGRVANVGIEAIINCPIDYLAGTP